MLYEVITDKIVSKGVESVRARVCNLKERNPSITVESIMDALKKSFAAIYGPFGPLEITDNDAVAVLAQRNASWEWKLGYSPEFDIETGARFPWGRVDFYFSLQDGKITDAHVYSDALDVITSYSIHYTKLYEPRHLAASAWIRKILKAD